MNWNRPLAPNFLKKFDHNLLLKNPETWSARTHWVWYYGSLFCLLLAGICFVYPNDARSNSGVIYWIFFVSIISILALVFWLIYLLRFNVFKRFGNITGLNRLKVFGLYFASVAMIVFFTYIPAIVETIRANAKYKDEEIVKDINNFNKLVTQLEYDSVDHQWRMDTFIVREEEYGMSDKDKQIIELTEANRKGGFSISRIDSSQFNENIKKGDTIIRLGKAEYEMYSCPNYIKLAVLNADDYTKLKLLDKIGIYRTVVKDFKRPDPKKAREEIDALMQKYYYKEKDRYSRYEYDTYSNSQDTTYEFRVKKRYQIDIVESSLRNIVERKYRFCGNDVEWQFRVLFYISLCFSLLVFAFRHSTTKTFFLSLLTAVILSILTGLLIAFSNGSEKASMTWLITYTLIFFGVSFTAFTSKTRSIFTGICVNLFVLNIPFLPITIVGLYNKIIWDKYYELERMSNYVKHPLYDKYTLPLVYGEMFGIVLLLILLPTLIHKFYRKWFALPQE